MTPPGQSEPLHGRGTALTAEPPRTATALASELARTELDLMTCDPAQPPAAPVERLFHASYPGIPEAVRAARRHVAAALAGVPCAGDVVYALSEVASNAVVHSRSGLPGGHFTVVADVLPGALAAIMVTDQGGPWADRAADTYPHGLEIVRRLAASLRIDGDEHGRTIWVLFPWEAKG
jgi:anti-sigma regulatory factor (Ser/Thr protein kinase)